MDKGDINLKVNFLLLILSLFFSIIYFNDQVAVRGGLTLSGEVDYKFNNSPLKYYFYNSWTIVTQLAALFFKLGFSTKLVSFSLVFLLTCIYFYSSYLLIVKFTNDKLIAIVVSCFLIFFQKNLGDTDYPSFIFTAHTFGALAQAITGLIITCVFTNRLKIALFLSLLLISVHPIVGIWLISLFVILLLIFYQRFEIKNFVSSFLIGILILSISVSFYLYSSIETLDYSKDLFQIYIEKWDGHRANTGQIHYEYLTKSLIFIMLINFIIYKKKEFKIGLFFLNLVMVSSIAIYLFFKIFYLNKFQIFSMIIPGRLMVTYTFILWPILIGVLYNKFMFKKISIKFFYFLIILYSLMHYKNFIIFEKGIKNINVIFNVKDKKNIYTILRNIDETGNIIATEYTGDYVINISRKPLLLMRSFDYMPYHPYLIDSLVKILTEIYGYSFKDPYIKNYPYLNDKFIKKIFENKSQKDWVKIKKKFNAEYLIAPKEWDIKMKPIHTDDKNNLFKI
mgnify:CR=1 FL=1